MANVVEYILSLRDYLTGKVKEARAEASQLDSAMHGITDRTREWGKELVGALGVGFALFKGFEFVKESKEDWEKLEFATSQVEAGLESTGHAAGLTFEELKNGAQEAAHNLKFTQAEVMGMQSILLTFPGVTKQTFGQASAAIYDMSTRLGQDLKSTAIQVGKALQDPEKGITALRRVGVNFNETQTEMIKNMVAGGHAAQAQAFILKELQTEFAGSAEAAAKADVSFRYEKSMEELRVSVGQLADKLSEYLMPALEAIAEGLKNSIQWMKEHKEIITAVAYVVGGAVAAYAAYGIALNAVSTYTKIATAVQWLWNAALTANPIGILIVAIGAAVGAIIYAYNHFGKFRATLLGVWETIKEFGRIVTDVFLGTGKVIAGVLTFNPKMVADGAAQTISAISNAGNRLGNAFQKGFNEGMADFAKSQAEKEAPKTVVKKAVGAIGPAGKDAKETSKATGNKSVNINIKIDNLIRDFSIKTTNIKDGSGRLKEIVTQTLLSAVNDSQLVAGQ